MFQINTKYHYKVLERLCKKRMREFQLPCRWKRLTSYNSFNFCLLSCETTIDINLLPLSLLIVLEVSRKECDPSKVSSIYEAEKFDDRLRIQRQVNG